MASLSELLLFFNFFFNFVFVLVWVLIMGPHGTVVGMGDCTTVVSIAYKKKLSVQLNHLGQAVPRHHYPHHHDHLHAAILFRITNYSNRLCSHLEPKS